jgi:hypothetical protein
VEEIGKNTKFESESLEGRKDLGDPDVEGF